MHLLKDPSSKAFGSREALAAAGVLTSRGAAANRYETHIRLVALCLSGICELNSLSHFNNSNDTVF